MSQCCLGLSYQYDKLLMRKWVCRRRGRGSRQIGKEKKIDRIDGKALQVEFALSSSSTFGLQMHGLCHQLQDTSGGNQWLCLCICVLGFVQTCVTNMRIRLGWCSLIEPLIKLSWNGTSPNWTHWSRFTKETIMGRKQNNLIRIVEFLNDCKLCNYPILKIIWIEIHLHVTK